MKEALNNSEPKVQVKAKTSQVKILALELDFFLKGYIRALKSYR